MVARIRRGVREPQMNTDERLSRTAHSNGALLTGRLVESRPFEALCSSVVALAAAAALAGCGGSASSGSLLNDVWTPWDAPIVPRHTDKDKMFWTEGEVTEVSRDGASLHFKIKRGHTPRMGAMIGLYVSMPEKPGPHYMWDESRELRVAEARVVGFAGDTCKAEIVDRTTNAPVSIGDKVIVRIR